MTGIGDWTPSRLTRRQVLKSGAAAVGGVGLMGLIAACGGDSEAQGTGTQAQGTGTQAQDTGTQAQDGGTPQSGGTITVAMSGGTTDELLDPARLGGGNENLILGSIYDRLVRFDNNFNIRPALAEEWEGNSDATQWTFALRPDLKFSDGSPLTTEDVASTINHILDESTGSSHFAVLSPNLRPDGIEIVDDRTIRFNLYEPNSIFPLTLGDKYVGIVKAGTAAERIPVGAGPFMIESWDPGQSWNAVRNPNYWQEGLPYLDGFRGVNVAESAALVRSLTAGEADVIGPIDFGQASQVEGNGTKVLEAKNAAFIFAVMDSREAPFDDPRVFEAVKIAVDRQAIINSAFLGYAEATTDVLLWPGNPAYPADLGVRDQDIERARSLLTDAGYENGIDLELFTSSALGGMVDFATAYQQVVEPAGIRIQIQQTDPSTYFSDITGFRPFFVNWTATRQPLYAILRFMVSDPVFPFTGFNNDEVDRLTAEAFATVDDDARNDLTAQALQIIADESPYSIPDSLSVLMAARDNVEGIEVSGAEFAVFTEAYLTDA